MTLISVTGDVGGTPDGLTVSAEFTCSEWLLGPTDDAIVAPFTVVAEVAEDGTFTVSLPSTDDPTWTPLGWSYAVRVTRGNGVFVGALEVAYNGGDFNLADRLDPDTLPADGATYATTAQLAALTGADLDIEIEDVNDLQTQLDGKQTAGTYLEPDDIANLVSTESLVEALVFYAKLTQIGVTALDHGYAGWTFDPAAHVQAGTLIPTAGLSHVVRFRTGRATTLITNILLHFTVGGGTLTAGQCFASLHTDAGVQIGITADQAGATVGSSDWSQGGLKTCPLVTPAVVTPDTWYKVRFWWRGTTAPTMSRATNSSSAIVNAGLSAPNFRFATADSGLTTGASAPATLGTLSGAATAWWVGLS